jgi:23S rRNA (pseudouridine1915-N3)-methyltransferase
VRLTVAAIGRLPRGPETDLVRLYADRATAAGKALGLGPLEVLEVEPRKTGKAAEAEALLAAVGADAFLVACDERGEALGSRAFAERVARWRDQGERRAVFLIGGADGLDPDLLARARLKLAFGPQTWPHALARAMLTEQLYRAVTILAGSPYHRD